jgi:hypothetical protein
MEFHKRKSYELKGHYKINQSLIIFNQSNNLL